MANTPNLNLEELNYNSNVTYKDQIENDVMNKVNTNNLIIDTAIAEKLDTTGDAKDTTVTFIEATTRENILTTDKMSILIGKIKKFFTDLKAVAFSGLASDVTITDTNNKYTSTNVDGALDEVSQQLEQKAPLVSPVFLGTPTINGIEIATVNNIPVGLSLGETFSTAYRGDLGKLAYQHSQVTHAPADAQKNSDITKAEIEAKLTGNISSHTHTAQTTITGNAGSATILQTARTINGVSFNGSANITIADATKAPVHQVGTATPSSYVGAGVLYGVY